MNIENLKARKLLLNDIEHLIQKYHKRHINIIENHDANKNIKKMKTYNSCILYLLEFKKLLKGDDEYGESNDN